VATYAAPPVATYAAPAVAAYAAPAVTAYAAPVATAVTKTVHYASTPVVTGYTSQVKLWTFTKGRVEWDDVKTDFYSMSPKIRKGTALLKGSNRPLVLLRK
jgi:hypothetical protein